MDFQAMSKQRKYVLTAAAIGAIAMFLPWFSIPFFGSINGMHGSGILIFFCFVGAGAIAFLTGDSTKTLDKTFWFIALVCGALAVLLILWLFIDASGNEIGTSFLGFGFYLSALSAIAVVVCAYLFRAPGDDIKSGFDSLKSNIEQKANSDTPSNP